MKFDSLKTPVLSILSKDIPLRKKLDEVCELLRSSVDYYDWVGFYFTNPQNRTLHLESFAGDPTDHTVIPFGKGICGQVAVSNENFVVPNVKLQDNYISCSIHVQSEIVIPLFVGGKNVGQIDIDSHVLDPFSSEDEKFLEWVNENVSAYMILDENGRVKF